MDKRAVLRRGGGQTRLEVAHGELPVVDLWLDRLEEARGDEQRGVVLRERLICRGRVRRARIGRRKVDLDDRVGLVHLRGRQRVRQREGDHDDNRPQDDVLLAPESRPDSARCGLLVPHLPQS